jgi:hypothetical protein
MNTNTLNNQSPAAAKPWWTFGMVWMIISGPAVVVVAAFATLYLAITIPDWLSASIQKIRSQFTHKIRQGDKHACSKTDVDRMACFFSGRTFRSGSFWHV